MPKLTESQKTATRKYKQKAYEKFTLEYKKGTKEKWQDEAKKRGMSLAKFIATAVQYYIDRE